MKKVLCVFLALCLLCTCFSVPVFAVSDSEKAMIMQPGEDSTKRNFSWYAPAGAEDACVYLSLASDMSGAVRFDGRTVDTYQGDRSAKVTVSGLEADTTYYYTCSAGGENSEIYSFTTPAEDSFSAVYVTDIHISYDGEGTDTLQKGSEKFASVLAQAQTKADLTYLLSAGDQASRGLRCEYTGLTAGNEVKSLAFATTVGNHDRKGVDYKYFNNIPNEYFGKINDYQSGDYWFCQNSVLFIFINSNNGSGIDHRNVIKEAVNQNPDAKWRVVVMHHDLYSGAIDSRESDTKALRILFSPIFDEFNIDLVLLGHNHLYSVTHPVYNGKTVGTLENGGVIENAEGTVYMVSNSITRPKDTVPTYNENVAIGLDENTSRVLYNIITFTDDEIDVTTYDYDENAEFASFTIKKDDDFTAPKISFFRKLFGFITSAIGTVYTFFCNITQYNKLTEDGYDLDFFRVLVNNKDVIDG